ncbi:hypothetical protein O0882_28055 [Janthinobacterium sp. SUN073]|uniref:hypothetical protein n=1 Tax=Janthinobacterium sp. SUN073 TaxID=3004102 RepID=UPI0025B19152|nr:hypothetical protein [Janthinobacterium sp. SUN073]MDN2700170.1 hypothetical protein [Janthinobacterium sp. SUN073]
MIFSKEFRGVRDGEIYPTTFQPGDECPSELIDAAQSLEVLEVPESKKKDK